MSEPASDEQPGAQDGDPASADAQLLAARENGWPAWTTGYLEAYRRAPSEAAAARAVGIARSTPWRLRQSDEAFALACHDARNEALDLLEDVIYATATRGLPVTKKVTKTFADGTVEVTEYEERHRSDVLAMFYLKRWRPEFREAFRVEQTGEGGGPVRIELGPRKRTRERMLGLVQLARELEVDDVDDD